MSRIFPSEECNKPRAQGPRSRLWDMHNGATSSSFHRQVKLTKVCPGTSGGNMILQRSLNSVHATDIHVSTIYDDFQGECDRVSTTRMEGRRNRLRHEDTISIQFNAIHFITLMTLYQNYFEPNRVRKTSLRIHCIYSCIDDIFFQRLASLGGFCWICF